MVLTKEETILIRVEAEEEEEVMIEKKARQ